MIPAATHVIEDFEHIMALDQSYLLDNNIYVVFDKQTMINTAVNENFEEETAEIVQTELIPDNVWTRLPSESIPNFTTRAAKRRIQE